MKTVLRHLGSALVGASLAYFTLRENEPVPRSAAHSAAPPPVSDPAKIKNLPEKEKTGTPYKVALDRENVQSVLRNKWSVKRRSEFQRILDGIDSFESAKLVYDSFLAEENDGRAYPELFTALLEKAGSVAGKEFMQLLRPSDLNATPPKSLDAVMRGWASTNPADAAKWLDDTDGFFRHFLATSLVRGMGEADPRAAAQQFNGLPAPIQSAAMSAMVEQMGQSEGLKGITDWYSSYGSGLEREGYPPNVLASMKQDLFNSAAERVALSDAHIAAPWFSKELSGSDAPRMSNGVTPPVANFMNRWANSDIDALGSWVSSMKGTGSYDALALQFVERAATLDSESSRAWAATIENPALNSKAMKKIQFLEGTVRVGTNLNVTKPK